MAGDIRGLTPRELAVRLRVAPCKVRAWIKSGELAAVNVGSKDRPRLVITPEQLAAFEIARSTAPAPRPAPRRRRPAGATDWFPDLT